MFSHLQAILQKCRQWHIAPLSLRCSKKSSPMQSWISGKSPVGFYPAVIRDTFWSEVVARHWVSSLEKSAMGKCCLSFPFPTSLGPKHPRTGTEVCPCTSFLEDRGSFILPVHGCHSLKTRTPPKTDGTGAPLPASRKISLFLVRSQDIVVLALTLSKGANNGTGLRSIWETNKQTAPSCPSACVPCPQSWERPHYPSDEHTLFPFL